MPEPRAVVEEVVLRPALDASHRALLALLFAAPERTSELATVPGEESPVTGATSSAHEGGR